mgnify:CR=1 FL=1
MQNCKLSIKFCWDVRYHSLSLNGAITADAQQYALSAMSKYTKCRDSSSAEIVVAAYRRSATANADHNLHLQRTENREQQSRGVSILVCILDCYVPIRSP